MTRLVRLLRAREGAVSVEFGLLGPVMITLMLGVLQVGIGMMSYNSLRSVAADSARNAVVNYQTGNKLSNEQISSTTRAIATTGRYNLDGSRLTIAVTTAATQRVTGAKELTLTISYNVPTVLSLVGVNDIPMSFSRPIFLLP